MRFAGEQLRPQEQDGEALQRERFGEGWWASFCACARAMAVALLAPSEHDFMPPLTPRGTKAVVLSKGAQLRTTAGCILP